MAITNFTKESIGLYMPAAPGQFLFTDRSPELGTGPPSASRLGFGICFFDMENDGYQDLAVANGHVRDDVETHQPGESYRQPALLFRNQRGQAFQDVTETAGAAPVSSNGYGGLIFYSGQAIFYPTAPDATSDPQ